MLEELGVLYRGALLGLMMAAPVGPVGLLCIRRTVQKGLLSGFATGFGAALADVLFSVVAAYGVTAIIETLRAYDGPIRVVGGAFLLLVAWHTWADKPRALATETQGAGMVGAARATIGSFLIMLTNPVAFFATLAVIATFGGLTTREEAPILVGGIFIGSALWWLLLSGIMALVRHRLTETKMLWINRVTAVALAALAFWAAGTGVASLAGLNCCHPLRAQGLLETS